MNCPRFGTEGWRGVIAYEITAEAMQNVARAIAEAILPLPVSAVVIGYDRRFLSEKFAEILAVNLATCEKPIILSHKPVTTPVISYAAKTHNAVGIMVTASHNPPEYSGIKIKGPHGGPVDEDFVRRVAESFHPLPYSPGKGRFERQDLETPYFEALHRLLGPSLTKPLRVQVVHDAMHGSAAGYLSHFWPQILGIRQEPNPGFGGTPPEPLQKYLGTLLEEVKSRHNALGFAHDGDGDRLGMVIPPRRFVPSNWTFALLLWQTVLLENKRGTIYKTFSTSHLIDQLAADFGLTLVETPIGFKHISNLMCRDELALWGGEESGGYGYAPFLPERDGTLAALRLMALAGEVPLPELLKKLEDRYGPHFQHRLDMETEKSIPLDRLKQTDRVLGVPLADIRERDGIKLIRQDGSWLMFRRSGTEPLLRIYAEAFDQATTLQLLSWGQEFIQNNGV